MAHHITVADEQYDFKSATRSKLFYLLGLGVFLFVVGVLLAMNGGNEQAGHGEGHASVNAEKLVASTTQEATPQESETAAKEEHHEAAEGDEETAPWKKKIYASLW